MDNTVSLSCLWTGCIRAWRRQSVINCLFSADCKRLPQSAICHVSNHPSRSSPLTPRETVWANSKAHDSLHLYVYIQTNGAMCSLMKMFNTDISWLTFRGPKRNNFHNWIITVSNGVVRKHNILRRQSWLFHMFLSFLWFWVKSVASRDVH